MILCKTTNSMKKRPVRTICISIDEMPKRPEYILKTSMDWKKTIKKCERMIRTSLEYRQYIQFLKNEMELNKCAVFQNIRTSSEKKYSIEIHHSPFTLYDIVQIVMTKHLEEYGTINLFRISKEVMELHYDGKVGLIPLTLTVHELVHNGKIFIPLNLIYQNYSDFVNEYESWMNDNTKEKILDIVQATEKCMGIQDFSNSFKTEFIYLNVDGFEFPVVPEEWGNRVNLTEILESDENNNSKTFRIGDNTL